MDVPVNDMNAERMRQHHVQSHHMSTRQSVSGGSVVAPQHITHRNRPHPHMRACPALHVASAPQPATAGILQFSDHMQHQV